MDASVLHEACSINNWLEDFRDITIPTNIVKVPQKLLEYFRDDLMILPTECQKSENDDTWGDDGDDDQVEVIVSRIIAIEHVHYWRFSFSFRFRNSRR